MPAVSATGPATVSATVSATVHWDAPRLGDVRSKPGAALLDPSASVHAEPQLELVAQRDPERAELRDLRLELPARFGDRAGSQLGQREAAALIEAKRVDVVVVTSQIRSQSETASTNA